MKECHYPLFQSNGGGDQSWEKKEEKMKRVTNFETSKLGERNRAGEGERLREGKKREKKDQNSLLDVKMYACLLTSLNVKFCSFHSTGKIISKKSERERENF